ncbi:TM0106 family RecB-like putative nuclease [Paracoccus sp. 1_MG-2023]|uniref:TM0106 family RecB-like putative nuclease n=1 Tax=unclassified Paracoccus (in: a-proteobacteria) TaxID=2688777 RepID=UPI001C0A1F61|nr:MULTISPECIES: TM0106 family RecB-like putative nuclease [unclassified Paracoccus (in: a-proteobacteria)]MBU2957819.1 TM0106 family RecB-like putative nuclease [Paracoccus sp. C2R09]MDO6667333.1 TM0106 family RecB-like putative nuclease [Paracoccus sp. 1_MG-2023]
MRDLDGRILFSASDLMRFSGCAHATSLDLAHLRGNGPRPCAGTDDAALLQGRGDAHEAAHLQRLRKEGRQITEIAQGRLADNAEQTRAALALGAEVVFQGAFLDGNWGGWSDFLERVERPSALGDFSYEVADTKLKRSPHPKHVLQLVLYSDLLARIQGVAPEMAHVELGSGERASLRLTDYAHYARAMRDRLEDFVERPPQTRPVPCADCALCRWADHCQGVWDRTDSLFNVAGITRSQVKRLEAAGIDSMAALATHDDSVRGIAPETFDRLKAQARLQHARKTGAPCHELRAHVPGRGFDLLPRPSQGDLFYDIEGDPHHEGGLEYLHGVLDAGGFQAIWAHDHAAEADALTALLDLFRDRIEADPDAHIYHYAPYEVTALRRLTAKYGRGEAFLDRLLREGRFVDLYSVVRGGLVASEGNYSIKSMERFYGQERAGAVTTAGGSVVAYERWRETGEDAILSEIEDYNRIDCVSTRGLRDWLLSIRPERPWHETGPDASAQEDEDDAETDTLQSMLDRADLTAERRQMLFDLGRFHEREAKPAWWAIFDSLAQEDDALIDGLDTLGGLRATGPAEPVARSVRRSYRFPWQDSKLRAGSKASIPDPEGGIASVTIEDLDRRNRIVTLKIGKARAHLLADRMGLHPDRPISTDVIADAVRDVIADQCGPVAYRAVDDLLARRAPRLTGGGPILPPGDVVAGTVAAVSRMDETVLPIQGPPGTGKTHISARAIVALVRDGYRVGVASNSHEAIRNVLMGCLKALPEDLQIDILHKQSGDDGYPTGCPVRRTNDNAEAADSGDIVGGTAFFFARPENIGRFDWLFVDEAGQVGLANMAAMGRAARNIVLVGDPRQLPQVIQGSHPEPANLSCLEWVLGRDATIPPDRGIFLGQTRRMHPAVNGFISAQVYEGRLTAHPDTARQGVPGTALPQTGAWFVPVPHDGNAQSAPEEVAAITAVCADLMAGRWQDRDGTSRPLRASDIIVVAPYNAQVNALREALPEAIRVGTVDKFQGQEAPVCLVSMTASSAEETPRGMEFLFSLNRINVAVSRAKALALIFGAPRLQEARCDTVDQMRLVNTLCALPKVPGR